MKKVIILLTLVVLLGGVILWQRSKYSISTEQITTSQDTELGNVGSSIPNSNRSFIEGLRQRDFKGGEIKIEETLSSNSSYTSYLITYPSDDLIIYGVMNVPKGNGLFPVIILNHGYYNPSSFTSGDGTERMADILAREGYLTLALDYRGHGRSESDGKRGGHKPEYAIVVLNLITSLKSIGKADTSKIGMWGHSMGGEVSLRVIEATDQVKAVVLWAPTSGNAGDNHAFYGGRDNQNEEKDIEGVSPINYLRYITAPISIHQGLSDSEVNPEWAKELYDALKNENKTVEYYEYKGQDHNFLNLGWNTVSARTLQFYEKYL